MLSIYTCYRRVSGITEEMLRDVDVRLDDVQRKIQALLPADAIIVAQSGNHDLHACRVRIGGNSLIESFIFVSCHLAETVCGDLIYNRVCMNL